MQLVASEGLEALTIHRLARELDYVPGALYRYFSGKDAIVAELQRRVVAELHERFRAAQDEWQSAAPRVCGPEQALFELLAAARFYASLPVVVPERFRLLSLLLGDPRQLIQSEEAVKTAPFVMAFLGDVKALFDAAKQTAALSGGRSMQRTLVYWSALHGVLQLDKLARFDDKNIVPVELAMQLAHTLLAGWGAEPTALEVAQAAIDRNKDAWAGHAVANEGAQNP